jgi:hypothetical protein
LGSGCGGSSYIFCDNNYRDNHRVANVDRLVHHYLYRDILFCDKLCDPAEIASTGISRRTRSSPSTGDQRSEVTALFRPAVTGRDFGL